MLKAINCASRMICIWNKLYFNRFKWVSPLFMKIMWWQMVNSSLDHPKEANFSPLKKRGILRNIHPWLFCLGLYPVLTQNKGFTKRDYNNVLSRNLVSLKIPPFLNDCQIKFINIRLKLSDICNISVLNKIEMAMNVLFG